jgi:plasmid stabilization system protein ParE
LTIKILDAAELDIKNGIDFYKSQNEGLGDYFLDSILSDIESLYIYAGVHIQIANYYRLLSKRFPFSIYYKISKNTILIYAILDCRQKPSWIDVRLK